MAEEIFGIKIHPPETRIGLPPSDLKFFVHTLTGRQKPITKLEITEHEGKTYAKAPPTDNVLVWNKKREVWNPNTQQCENIPGLDQVPTDQADQHEFVLPISLAELFDSISFSEATNDVIQTALETFGNDAKIIRNSNNKIIAIVVPSHPGKLAKPKDDAGEKWEEIDLLRDKEIPGKLVLIPENTNLEADFSNLAFGLKQVLGEKGYGQFESDLLFKFQASAQILERYQDILSRLNQESFDQGYFPGEQNLADAIQMIQQFKQVSDQVVATVNELADNDLRKKSTKKKLDNVPFPEQDLADRLFRLGVRKDVIQELFPGLTLDDEFFKTKRTNKTNKYEAREIFQRYGRNIIFSVNQYIDQIRVQTIPEAEIISMLADNAVELLLDHLDIPDSIKAGLKGKIPESVKKWLEKGEIQRTREELKKQREKLQKIARKEQNLTPEEQKELEKDRQTFEKHVVEKFKKTYDFGNKFYPPYPIENLHQLFENWRQGREENSQILDLLREEQVAKYDLAQLEQSAVEQILDFQQKYEGWKERGWKEEKEAVLESTPQRIIIDKEITCIGREGLVFAMMQELGIDNIYTCLTYKHGFIMFEDSFGIARIVEPSGWEKHSSYHNFNQLHYLSDGLKNQSIIRKELPVMGNLEQVNIMKGKSNWELSVIKNALILLNLPHKKDICQLLTKLNPLDDGFWNERGVKETKPMNIFCYLQSLRLNNWNKGSFYNLNNWREDFKTLALDRLSQAEREQMRENLDYLIETFGTPNTADEKNPRHQIKRRSDKRADKLGKDSFFYKKYKEIAGWHDGDFDAFVGDLEKLRDRI